MTNLDRILKDIQKGGTKNVLIHTIPGTSNWLICQKFEPDKWLITLCNPMKNVSYNLGTVNNQEHLALWYQLANKEIEMKAQKISTSKLASELRHQIKQFLSGRERIYNLLKKHGKLDVRKVKSGKRRQKTIRQKSSKGN